MFEKIAKEKNSKNDFLLLLVLVDFHCTLYHYYYDYYYYLYYGFLSDVLITGLLSQLLVIYRRCW